MEFRNLRNYEILNENPKITYIEADYVGANEWGKNYGYIRELEGEKMCIFSADRPERLKKIFKESMLKDLLSPKEYEIIKIGGIN